MQTLVSDSQWATPAPLEWQVSPSAYIKRCQMLRPGPMGYLATVTLYGQTKQSITVASWERMGSDSRPKSTEQG